MADIIDREIGWDDEIERDGQEWITLPEGDYDFIVTAFERGRHNGSEKLPACNKAVLSLTIDVPEGTTTIRHNLFLHSRTEGMISAFLIGIGQKKHGEATKPNWRAIVGAKGKAKVIIRKWKGDDGIERTNNEVKKFYEPEDKSVTPGFTPGAF